jgi:hypothetical protein
MPLSPREPLASPPRHLVSTRSGHRRGADRRAARGAAAAGRDRYRAAPADTEPAEAENEPPFSIHDAADAETAAECVRRALAAEGLAIGEITGVSPERWDWRTVARLSKGKPGDLVAKLPNLDVRLGVRQGGVMAQPQKEAAVSVVLRIITSTRSTPCRPTPCTRRAPTPSRSR